MLPIIMQDDEVYKYSNESLKIGLLSDLEIYLNLCQLFCFGHFRWISG